MKKILLQDTTLRDGEQTPGVAYSCKDKIKLTNIICNLGIDTIEIGFPAASKEEKNIIKEVSSYFPDTKATFCAFARAKISDVEIAYESIKKAKYPKIQIVAPASDIHINYSTNGNKDFILKSVEETINFAKKKFNKIQFTAQDAPRADKNFLDDLVKIAIKNGATEISLPDTAGFCLPNEYSILIKNIKLLIGKNIILSAHCHNDLGLATANSIAAIEAGADQVECTLNGIGERAGNTPLEEVVAILDLKYKNLISNNLNLKLFKKASKELENLTNIKMHNNKPLFGRNVFMHSSGMHQKAILREKETFEVINAEKYGMIGGKLSIGKLSGKVGIKKFLQELLIEMKEEDMDNFIAFIKKQSIDIKEINHKNINNFILSFKENRDN